MTMHLTMDQVDHDVCFAGSKLVMFHTDLPYNRDDVFKSIENLGDSDIIGSGGFGTVYRLVMDDGCTFAVKKIGKQGISSQQLFEKELGILGSFKHQNLVNLRGYCNAPLASLLIYDFLPKGNLDENLHGRYFFPKHVGVWDFICTLHQYHTVNPRFYLLLL